MKEKTITSQNGTGNGLPKPLTEIKDSAHGRGILHISALGEIEDVMLSTYTAIREHGREAAIKSGDLEPNPERLKVLQNDADAMAEKAYCEEFDSGQYTHDLHREREFDKAKADRAEAEHNIKHASADIGRYEEEAAAVNETHVEFPAFPWLFAVIGFVVLALFIAPTAHDFIFITIPDDLVNWLISLVGAVCVGAFIALGILASGRSNGERSTANWVALIGGIFITLGLGLMRIAFAQTSEELYFAIAITIVEVGTVVLLEATAASRRAELGDWSAHNQKVKTAAARIEAAQSKVARFEKGFDKAEQIIVAHILYVEQRHTRRNNIEQIKVAARQTVTDGYFAGIGENRGKVSGAWKPKTKE